MNATWASVILGSLALISLSVTVVLVTAAYRQALQNLSRNLERLDARHERHLDTVLDRLMAVKWEDFVALRSTVGEEQEGGFYPPTSGTEEDTAVIEQTGGMWGRLGSAADRLRLNEEEQILLDEDFDEEGSPRKAPE